MHLRTGLDLIVALCSPAAAFGHARLVNSSPADGIAVPFQLAPDAKPTKIFSVALPALKPALYRVEWTVLAADDGHVTKGAFSFTIAAAH